MADDAVSASARGATFLILLQIGSRAITFALNQVLLRFLSPGTLGVSVQLELFKTGILYFSRESLRVAAERRSSGGVQASINVSYLSIFIGVPISALLSYLYMSVTLPDVPFFSEALRVSQLAALVELLMEPAFTAVQQKMLYKTRAAAEGSSVVLKTLAVFSIFFWANSRGVDLGVLPFAIGELVNSIVLTFVYWILTTPVARASDFSLFPRTLRSSPDLQYVFSLFSKPLLWLIGSLFFQTGIKWLLTEGDKLLIGALASLEDQGMYALSANYGGLIARMLFQPVENSSRNLFAKLCTTDAPTVEVQTSEKKSASVKGEYTSPTTSNTKFESTAKSKLQTASTLLQDILRIYSIASLFAFAIGPTATPVLLRLVAGSRWSDSGAGEVLGTFCYYIPFLAINGVSEAFVAATASTKDLRNQSLWMTGFSALFAASAYVFLRVLGFGAKGLVWANCVNMALRIVFNLWFVKSYFRDRGVDFSISELMPRFYALGAAASVPAMLSQSQNIEIVRAYGLLGDLLRIGAVGAGFAAIVGLGEKDFLAACYRRFRA